jgi:hypothetical protein
MKIYIITFLVGLTLAFVAVAHGNEQGFTNKRDEQ